MSELPTDISRTDDGLQITWSDRLVTRFTARQLRDACPCATCREKRRDGETSANDGSQPQKAPMILPVLSVQETRPMQVRGMKPVGNYAYNINFSDGHDSGLFTFDFLRLLSAESKPSLG